jgi:glycosyltransferase involved in cell wall biosynthesis
VPGNGAAPRVSVCVPTYNGEKYLEDCIESILAQSFQDFDLLIVDDGSRDRTVEIARRYEARDARVRVVENERNHGLAANWNRCAELARGEWIKFVFQDDLILPACLERMLGAARNTTAFVACRREFRFEEGTTESARDWYLRHAAMIASLPYRDNALSAEDCRRLALERLGENLFGEPTAVMLHRDVFTRYGMFNPALIMLCDLEYWTRVTIHTGAVHVPEVLAVFRLHAEATSATNHARRHYRTNVLDKLIILHDYVHDPLYEPLRQAAKASDPPVRLEEQFRTFRHQARASAAWARQREHDPDPSALDEWRDVAKRYPRIAVSDASHALWRVRSHLRRAVSRS